MPALRRREFMSLLGSASAWPLAARVQHGERVRRLAVMMGGRNADTDVEGRNFRADYRWPAGDLDRMQVIAKEFVDLQPDVLVAGNTPAVISLLQETRTIPIVFTLLSDPVGTGVVASLARPGGNATGFTAFEYSLAGKWLEMLKDIAPAVTRVALLFNPETSPYAKHYLSFIETAAPAFKVAVTSASIRSVSEMEEAVTAHAREPGGGLVVLPDTFTFANRGPLILAAARHGVPAIYPLRGQDAGGGLCRSHPTWGQSG